MIKPRFVAAVLLLSAVSASARAAEPQRTDVFTKGDAGYACFRIPSVVTTKSGTLLAFAEARKKSCSDTGNIDLVMRRSTDGGKTWSDLAIIWNDADNTCGNPCPVVDETTGTVWLLLTWNRGDDHESKIKTGKAKDTRRVFATHSTDEGVSWAKPTEITSTTKRDDWGWYATGPGAGIQLQRGKHKGRLVVPCDHSTLPWGGTDTYRSHVIYSDDHGKTWQLGGSIKPGVNECEVVELTDGRLMMNMRNYRRSQHRARAIAISDDGGASWSDVSHDPALIEPVCQASIRRLRWPTASSPGVIVFSNPASTSKRVKMTVRVSYDDAKTWPVSRVLHPGPSAYSSLTILKDKRIGCLYEADGYKRIKFAVFTHDWLRAKP